MVHNLETLISRLLPRTLHPRTTLELHSQHGMHRDAAAAASDPMEHELPVIDNPIIATLATEEDRGDSVSVLLPFGGAHVLV